MTQYIVLQDTPQNAPERTERDFNVVTTVSELPHLSAPILTRFSGDLATAINEVLANEHWLLNREWERQFERWCKGKRRPNYFYEVPDLWPDVHAAIKRVASAILQSEVM